MLDMSIEANIPGKEWFINHWTQKANDWFKMIKESDISVDSKLELIRIIETNFLKGYVRNKNRGSVTIFTRQLAENLSFEESVLEEGNKKDKIIGEILSDVEILLEGPKLS